MKKLDRWAKKVKPHSTSLKNLREFLKKEGFVPTQTGEGRFCFLHKTKRVVVKRMFCSDLPPPPIAIPTKLISTRKKYLSFFGWGRLNIVVQPLAQIDEDIYFDRSNVRQYDLHCDNLGRYRNKIVAFDW